MTLSRRRLGGLIFTASLILIVVLVLVKMNIDENNEFLCEAVHSNPNLEMTQCPVHNSNTSWVLLVAFSVAFLFSGMGGYLLMNPFIMPGKPDFIKPEPENLDEEEKRVYELLKQKEGSMYQSDLIRELDYSKVHMTRLLDKMEAKQLIDRKRRGMTNIVILK